MLNAFEVRLLSFHLWVKQIFLKIICIRLVYLKYFEYTGLNQFQ